MNALSCAVDRAKQGNGPAWLEAKAFRWHGHYEGDPQKYKTPEKERESPHDFDPLSYFSAQLAPGLKIGSEELTQIKAEEKKIQDAIAFAEASPPARLEAIAEDVFDETG